MRNTAPPSADCHQLVEDLASDGPHVAAWLTLVSTGRDALPAVRSGLRHRDPKVRAWCCSVLDHTVDAESFPHLVAMLDDPHPSVRIATLHALGCDRCKQNGCQPPAEVLPRA